MQNVTPDFLDSAIMIYNIHLYALVPRGKKCVIKSSIKQKIELSLDSGMRKNNDESMIKKEEEIQNRSTRKLGGVLILVRVNWINSCLLVEKRLVLRFMGTLHKLKIIIMVHLLSEERQH